MPAPTTQQARLHVEAVRDWPPRDQVVVRTFRFEGFLESIDLVNWIARKAQELDEHPDIEIGSDAVTLKLTTHDEWRAAQEVVSMKQEFRIGDHLERASEAGPVRSETLSAPEETTMLKELAGDRSLPVSGSAPQARSAPEG